MPKKIKGQLVFQHLEKISRKLLEDYPELVKEVAKAQNGIYALYSGDKLYYVGLAKNLRSRLRSHLRDRHRDTWDRFSIYLTLSDKHLKELESLVLRIASPKGNVIAGRFIKSENLLSTIRKRIREIQREERIYITGGEKKEGKPKRIRTVRKKQKNLGPLVEYMEKRFRIRREFKGKKYIARVSKDGWIIFDRASADYERLKGKKYRSPSGAGVAVTNRPVDGWRWWQYKNAEGKWVYLDELRKKSEGKPRRAKREGLDTIVVPANEEGFREVFLGENCWYKIRISSSMIDRIKYIAAYQTAPIQAITYYAEILRIAKYKDTGKYIIYFKDKARRIGPIKLSIRKRGVAPQAPRYTTFEKLQKAKTLSEVF